jgi:hypothetical protein
MRLPIVITVVIVLWAATASADTKDPFDAKHQRDVTANPSNLHLKISLEGGRDRFRIGDTIRVQYVLTAYALGQFVAGARVYDRSHRSTLETFVVDRPADAPDPLRGFWSLYDALYCWNYSGGEGPTKKLGPDSPQQDSFEVTRYLHFSKPGRYRLYAVTRSAVPTNANPRDRSGPPLASENTVSFEVLPQDVKNARNEITEILVRASDPQRPQFTPTDAFRLFEIGTPEARRAAAKLAIPQNNYAYSHDIALATMIADPSRTGATALMKSRLLETNFSVDADLLMDLALLQLLEQKPSLSADSIARDSPEYADRWRNVLVDYLRRDIRLAMSTLDKRPAAMRASTIRALFHLTGYRACSVPFPLSPQEKAGLASLHLASLADLPQQELASELLNFGWAQDFPNEQVMPVLVKIYEDPPVQNANFIRDTVLKNIQKIDPDVAGKLFREKVLSVDTKLDWLRIRYLNLAPNPELDADLISALEGRWTDKMSHAAPLIGLYATPSILPRAKQVYEVHAGDWPCSVEAGLLTYFLRVDPAYGIEKTGPSLEAYYTKGGSDCSQGSLLVDMALLRNSPELKTFATAALSDSRPHAAAAGARAIAMGDVAQIPYALLLARLRALRGEWSDFEVQKNDAEYMRRWNLGYNELERMIEVDFVNMNDTPEHAAAWKQAYDLCVSDQCRESLRKRMDRSRY